MSLSFFLLLSTGCVASIVTVMGKFISLHIYMLTDAIKIPLSTMMEQGTFRHVTDSSRSKSFLCHL